MNRKLLLFFGVLILGLLAVGLGYRQYQNSFQEVTLDPPANSEITLYEGIPVTEELQYKEGAGVLSGSQKVTKKIKKGYYIYVVKPANPDYKTLTNPIDIGDQPTAINPALEYTDQKLLQIAIQESGNIQNFLASRYPTAMPLYSVGKIEAYGDGSWFGVRFDPKDLTHDVLVGVVKKENNGFTVKTNIPSIIVAEPAYPDIPKEIIGATNRLIGPIGLSE